jgi:hypothetical protein
MVGRVLFAVDGSVPSREAAALAHDLLPKAGEILVLQVVPQLPYAWNTWPAFPDLAQDLTKAWAYVSEVGDDLEAQCWNVSTRVDVSPLSAAEIDQSCDSPSSSGPISFFLRSLAKRLCQLAGVFHAPSLETPDVHVSQEALADMVGATREAVNKQLAKLREMGVIETGRGHVRILRSLRLRALAMGNVTDFTLST